MSHLCLVCYQQNHFPDSVMNVGPEEVCDNRQQVCDDLKSVITVNKLVMTVLGSVLKLMLEKSFLRLNNKHQYYLLRSP